MPPMMVPKPLLALALLAEGEAAAGLRGELGVLHDKVVSTKFFLHDAINTFLVVE